MKLAASFPIRKELIFGFSLMAIILLGIVIAMPAPWHWTSGHYGLFMLAMIVVTIISILAAIAVPAYNNYVLRGQLAEALSGLAAQRARMEQFYQALRT